MPEIVLQIVVGIIVALAYIAIRTKLRHLEHRINQLGDWLARDIHRIEHLEKTMPSSLAKGGWVRGVNPVKETDWMPPSMKHTDIKE